MNKKTIYGGIIQSVLILLIYMILAFVKNDHILIYIFIYSFFLSFNVLKNTKNNILFNDTKIIFLIFLFLYGIFNPILQFIIEETLSISTYFATIIYASCIPAYTLGVILIKSNNYDLNYLSVIQAKVNKSSSYIIFLILILILLLLYVSYDFYSQGILFKPSIALKISRLELFTDISQLNIVVGLLISSIFLFFIYYFSTFSNKIKSLIIILLFYFILMELSVGNRRDFLPMIVGLFWVFVNTKKISLSFYKFVFLILGLFIFLFLGSVRSSATSDEAFNYVNLFLLTLSSNEFVYPFYTLGYSVSKFLNDSLIFSYGTTIFFHPFLFFIPRLIFPDKPLSLAVQFVNDIDSTMGYAYSPVTEFFVNFGFIGPFFGFLIIGLIISKIQSFRDQRLNFVIFTMIPDFCRGEIATFLYQLIVISFFIIILPSIFSSKLKLKN